MTSSAWKERNRSGAVGSYIRSDLERVYCANTMSSYLHQLERLYHLSLHQSFPTRRSSDLQEYEDDAIVRDRGNRSMPSRKGTRLQRLCLRATNFRSCPL